ncbi:MAG: ABC transporter permease [Clostridia bacterium]|nr:ABC transporter permease [Clostridia bacterium]
MRFADSFKIALHSIIHNKIRTLITVIIVLVVSLLIMVISIMLLSFYKSVDNAYVAMFDKTGAVFNLQNYYVSADGTSGVSRGINQAEYEYVINQFAPYPELIDNAVISGNLESYYLYDMTSKPTQAALDSIVNSGQLYSRYNTSRSNLNVFSAWGDLDYMSKDISYLKAGRLWDIDDEGTKNVWVSESFIANASLLGNNLKIGDNVVISCQRYITEDNITYTLFARAEVFKIRGIFLNEALEELNCNYEIFVEAITMYEMMEDNLDIYSLRIISEPKYGYVFNEEYKKMATIVKNVNSTMQPNIYNKRESKRFRCDIVDNLTSVRTIGGVMIGAGVFIGFIILIISIGSVANSVMISVDKNKKFFGVMMAVGLTGSGIKRIVQQEILCVIIIATGIAYGLLNLFKAYFYPLVDSLMAMVGFTSGSVVIMPFYIPIIVVAAFIIMSLLFARKSLSRVINMDVISVISEVA